MALNPLQKLWKAYNILDTQLKRTVEALQVMTEERDDLQRQKDEHQRLFPGGCADARTGPEAVCINCVPGRPHSILCYPAVSASRCFRNEYECPRHGITHGKISEEEALRQVAELWGEDRDGT